MTDYDRKSVRKAMLLAPLAGWVGVLPFLINLNFSIGQFLLVSLAVVLGSYLITLIVGSIGYFSLKAMGLAEWPWLLGYAAVVVILGAIVSGDGYFLLSVGPAAALITGLFCYLRKHPVKS